MFLSLSDFVGNHAGFHRASDCAIYIFFANKESFLRIVFFAGIPVNGEIPIIHFALPGETADGQGLGAIRFLNFNWNGLFSCHGCSPMIVPTNS
jgi:hypothetical protein